MPKRWTDVLLLLILLMLLAGGCQTAEKKPLENQPQEQTGITASDRRVLADQLSRLATEVEGVQKATVVISDITLAENGGNGSNNNDTIGAGADISGMIVMIGISINEQADAEQVKPKVRDKLRNSDERISQVLVTSDPELVKKINEVAAGIIKGEPITEHEMNIKQLGKEFKASNPAF